MTRGKSADQIEDNEAVKTMKNFNLRKSSLDERFPVS